MGHVRESERAALREAIDELYDKLKKEVTTKHPLLDLNDTEFTRLWLSSMGEIQRVIESKMTTLVTPYPQQRRHGVVLDPRDMARFAGRAPEQNIRAIPGYIPDTLSEEDMRNMELFERMETPRQRVAFETIYDRTEGVSR